MKTSVSIMIGILVVAALAAWVVIQYVAIAGTDDTDLAPGHSANDGHDH